VRDLDPDPSLFKWQSVSNIPSLLLGTAIEMMQENASKLRPPPSSDDIPHLKRSCITFRDDCRKFVTVKNERHN
jgi:hypothetical protein